MLKCFLYANFFESIFFYREWMLNFAKSFFASIEMILYYLSFILLIQFIILIALWILSHHFSPLIVYEIE